MKTRYAAALGLSAVISLAGCPATPGATSAQAGSTAKRAEAPADGTATQGATTGAGKGAPSEAGMSDQSGAPMPSAAAKPSAPSAAASTAPMAPGKGSAEAVATGGGNMVSNNAGAIVSDTGAGFAPPTDSRPVSVDPLKAGAVDDNAKYKDYMEYVSQFDADGGMAPRKLDVSERHVIRVVDANGKGVANADITIKNGETLIAEARTYADGRTLFHPTAYHDQAGYTTKPFAVTVTKGQAKNGDVFFSPQTEDWVIKLSEPVAKPAAKLDMAIVLDTTGSMGGEIQKFQQTINTISTRLQALPQQPSVRFGLVAYKDQGEQYVSKVASPFTADLASFQQALNLLSPGGGGDKPEDLESALSDTVNKLAWDDGETVRLSFVVTDASAHTDYPQSTPYTDSMQLASKKGIKLYAIGASSLEPTGEYQLRQLAQWTMGKYLFVTRGGDEATGGGGTASATVDAFREGRLDDIVVDIVKAELDKLGQ